MDVEALKPLLGLFRKGIFFDIERASIYILKLHEHLLCNVVFYSLFIKVKII